MESAATDEKPKQIASFSAPPLPPPPQPPPPSQQQNQHPQQPPPLQQPQQQQQQPPGPSRPLPPPEHSHTLPPPRSQFEPWSRPYPPFEGANADQRGHPVFNGPPREGSHHPQDMYSRPPSISGPPRTHSDPSFRPINGNSHEPSSSSLPPTPTTEYRPSFPYGPPSDGHGNGEPPRGLQMMPPPPPTPDGIPIHRPYGSGAHMPPGAAAYDAGYYFAQANVPYSQRQRRTTRAQQACDQCRARKAKCDEGRPSCGHCKDSNVQCVYKDVPPHKHERSTQILLERLQQIDDRFDKFENIEKIDEVVKLLKAHTDKLDALLGRANRTKPSSSLSDPELKQPVQNAATPQQGKGAEMEPVKLSEKLASDAVKQEQGDIQVEADDDELSIPIEHTTAAHKLLLWPSIQKLIPDRIDDDYVMRLEESRGPIRPYGRGEGGGSIRTSVYPLSPIVSSSSPRDEDMFQFCGSGWGTGFEIFQGNSVSKIPKERQIGGLNSAGALDLDVDVVYAYHKSYMENMHILHPFLRSTDLAIMVKDFVNAYSPPKRGHFAAPPFGHIVANDSMNTLNRSQKRKRSVDVASGYTELESPGSDHSMGASCPPIQRSMDNAIVLLVLALGAICSWKMELPGPIPDPPSKLPYVTSAVSPVTMDSAMPSTNAFRSPTSRSPNNIQGWKRSGSYSGSDHSDPNLKNMDVIPGMAYYALASDILGNLQGGNDLAHAQGCLLAALYTGQLAHPFASHGWISQAARACQVLVRARSFEVMPDGPRKDLITFAFWTCLQLESDILAELDLPASGISRLEGRMEFPKAVFAHSIPNEIEAPDTLMMMYYSAQIHLRKVLNRVHTNLYKTEKTANGEKRTRWTTTIQEALSDMLEYWRSGLPKAMQWDDSDPPARDINIARMRGKYYGARYIIHRPLLHHALHPMIAKTHSTGPAESPAPSVVSSANSQISPALAHVQQVENIDRWSGEMPPPPRITSSQDPPQPPFEKDLDPKLHAACVACIEAAMHSTVAFDNVEGRPIVTNIFGTAHAQFGNILVLAATYTSRLSNFVDRKRLGELIDRTIKFLLHSRHISPSLRKDAEILTQIRQKLFEQHGVNNTSFSSSDG
ncbi:C6 zinc finger domain-containing protein [Coccidioides immitis RS]|uniref:C6 zinc finger domain-containing protein n=1 Tax=Coccidioides immitis (strain RS) TaxID=246410 RepID=J3KI18_COCIM|nr:C6 zinc finger domain-containing protein [Coccidioides immitis RS]EAS35563.3 C6 zinc finger domain-containing protein [Coccidioides immitis RS]